jgi:hypothetical protein
LNGIKEELKHVEKEMKKLEPELKKVGPLFISLNQVKLN